MHLGTPPEDLEPGEKDAFHAPAVVAVCQQHLNPGDSVRFTNGFEVVKTEDVFDRHGIVDPFGGWVESGLRFWMLVNPMLIRGRLTHNFDINVSQGFRRRGPYIPEPYDECAGC